MTLQRSSCNTLKFVNFYEEKGSFWIFKWEMNVSVLLNKEDTAQISFWFLKCRELKKSNFHFLFYLTRMEQLEWMECLFEVMQRYSTTLSSMSDESAKFINNDRKEWEHEQQYGFNRVSSRITRGEKKTATT